LTNIEAYLDLYLVTGEKRYYEAAHGAWELYHAHWQHAGGSISIIEFENDPPDSSYLRQKLGELCGSSFWVFLSQRFQLLHPDDEQYATEIEKSIYNIGIANQDEGNGFRYHTIMEGQKEESTHYNTCCEGQGTRLVGSLPEHIYSIAPDGLYMHLYEPSTVQWKQDGRAMALGVQTRFPLANEVVATIKVSTPTSAKIRIRVPSWASGDMKVAINGKEAGTGKPGTYVVLDRLWSDGDKVSFNLPASVRVTRYRGADSIAGKTRYSAEYGPILLAAVGASDVDLVVDRNSGPESLGDHLEPVAGSPLHFTMRGSPDKKLIPYYQISNEKFTCYPTISVSA
jgi:DUF1680 family protein